MESSSRTGGGEESKISPIITTGQSPIKDFYNPTGKSAVSGEIVEEGGPVRKVTPYKSSSKEFSLSAVDFDIVTRYRTWLADYF